MKTNLLLSKVIVVPLLPKKINTNLLQSVIEINAKTSVNKFDKNSFLVKKLLALKETLKVNLKTNCQQQKVVLGCIYDLLVTS